MEPNAILSESLSLSSDIPLYAQLVGIIKRSISSGALAIGDLLPSILPFPVRTRQKD